MKSTRKAISILLTVLMLISCVSVSFTVNASTGTLCDKYATNPQGKIGVKKTITIDGSFSDWSSDMLIAQGAAWDVANHYKGGHENCVLDTYALYAAWDNDNLYVAWQMVNTTDTWAREGDGPLSDGGRVLDVPLILALSVDPSSTSMSNKNTNGGPIWGQKMGLTFNQHVDHLLYMSGKVGNGTPGMFTAVDSQGNTNYTNGLKTFSANGIEYKMAEGNVCDSIIGLNYSKDPSDVYSNDADWVDYKTFKGSSGAHNTKYDSFYEIKIPLSTLGINSSYIENNGIGAMVVATRGESGLDCIPFDDTMLDNATASYGSDASTSHEKDDEDVITSSFARIGNLGGGTPVTQPTTAKPTTQPTTAKPTTQATTAKPTTQPTTAKTTTAPVFDTLTVNAKSNLFASNSVKADNNANTVTVTYNLQSSMQLVNGQWSLSYDSSKLKLVSSSSSIMPNISDGLVNCKDGIIMGNFTNVTDLYNFTSSKPLVQATFEIIGNGSTDVNLNVQELSVGYKANNSLVYKNAVVNSVKQDLSGVSGFESLSMTGSASAVTDVQPTTVIPTQATTVKPTQATTQPTTAKPTQAPTTASSLKVNATSNFFPAVTKTYSESEKKVTVSYKLSSSMDLVNSEWTLKYDTSKLAFNSSNYRQLMPNVSSPVINENTKGRIVGNFSTISFEDFTNESDFVTITFDVIGTGTADVDLFVNILGIAYDGADNSPVIAYIVDFGEIKNVTSKPGFENEKYTVRTVLGPQTTPTTVPTTVPVTTKPTPATTQQPTTAKPTQAPTTASSLKVNATSNFFPAVSKTYSESEKKVTVSYKLSSSMDLVNSEWTLTYDTSKLAFNSTNYRQLMPNVSSPVINENTKGRIVGNFSTINFADFTNESDFVTITFDVIGTGTADVDLFVNILGIAYDGADNSPVIAYLVDFGEIKNVTSKPGFENEKYTVKTVLGPQTTPTTVPTTVPVTTKPTQPTTSPVTDTLKVNATSNILSPVSQEYNKDTSTVTVSYKLKSSMELVNSQWTLTYDNTKLSYDPQKNKSGVMPNVKNAVINTSLSNKIKGDFSSLSLYDFTTEKDFVTVTFDIIGKGETTVDLDVEILGVAYIDSNDNVITAYPVDYSKFFDVTSTPGFESMKLSGRITLNEPIETILYGDVNNDGIINVTDATLVQKHAADLIKLTDDELKRADVNFDGVVNIHDSTRIRKYIAGLIPYFK